MNTETIPCNLCLSTDTTLFSTSKSKYSDDIFTYVQCKKCGLVYENPRQNSQESYNGYMRDKSTIPYYAALWQKRSERGKVLLKRYIMPYVQGKKESFVDIGAGTGAMLESARSFGFTKFFGIEPNVIAGEHGHAQNPEFNIVSADICDPKTAAKLPKDTDVVLSFHTFEHLYDPSVALKNIHQTLKKDGILVIVIPQILFFQRLKYKFLKKDDKGVLDSSAHLYYFSSHTLAKMAEKEGFEIIRAEPAFYHFYPLDILMPNAFKFLFQLLLPSALIIARAKK